MEGTIPLKHLKNIAGRWKGASKRAQLSTVLRTVCPFWQKEKK
jgi:hypothetical protein